MEVKTTDYSKAASHSWDSLSFFTLLEFTWFPVLVASALLISFAWWQSTSNAVLSVWYEITLLTVYLIVFAGYSILLLRRAHFTRAHMAVIMGFAGFSTGLLVAIGKIIILFRGWALLRLISEPILTAFFAALIGVLIFWRRPQLKSS